jgi:serine protease Do
VERPSPRRTRSDEDDTAERRAPARRPTPAPAPEPDEEIEPEVETLDIPEAAVVGKEDFGARKREVMAKAPGLFGLAMIINLVAFIVCVGGGIFVVKMLAITPKSDKATSLINEYKDQSAKISSEFEKHLKNASALGKVDGDAVLQGVKGKYASAGEIILKSTVTVIADIDMFERGRPHRIEYYGSGFVFLPDGARSVEGYIVTCHENIAGARSVRVMLSDKTVYDARIIGSDAPANLAVLQIDQEQMKARKPSLSALEWADSDDAKENVAQYVMAGGAPLGRVNSISMGIISCPDRYVLYTIRTGETSGFYNQLFQTDAEVNWGSSGGPLADLDGKVVGVCVTTNGLYDALGLQDYNGLFFAIHGNFARRIANEIKRNGKVNRSYTGIFVDSIQALSLESSVKGAAVVGIEPGSPGETGGLRPGDIITKATYTLNGEKQTILFNARNQPDVATIYDQLSFLPINTEVEFEVRDLTNSKKDPVKITTGMLPRNASDVVNAERWGLVVSPLGARDSAAYGIPEGVGVKVLAVMQGSPAERAGLTPGNVIIEIEGRPIADVRSFRDRYENLNAARTKTFGVTVRRNRGARGVMGNDLLRLVVRY